MNFIKLITDKTKIIKRFFSMYWGFLLIVGAVLGIVNLIVFVEIKTRESETTIERYNELKANIKESCPNETRKLYSEKLRSDGFISNAEYNEILISCEEEFKTNYDKEIK